MANWSGSVVGAVRATAGSLSCADGRSWLRPDYRGRGREGVKPIKATHQGSGRARSIGQRAVVRNDNGPTAACPRKCSNRGDDGIVGSAARVAQIERRADLLTLWRP